MGTAQVAACSNSASIMCNIMRTSQRIGGKYTKLNLGKASAALQLADYGSNATQQAYRKRHK